MSLLCDHAGARQGRTFIKRATQYQYLCSYLHRNLHIHSTNLVNLQFRIPLVIHLTRPNAVVEENWFYCNAVGLKLVMNLLGEHTLSHTATPMSLMANWYGVWHYPSFICRLKKMKEKYVKRNASIYFMKKIPHNIKFSYYICRTNSRSGICTWL